MARFAIIEDGKVINIAEAEADFAAEQGWIETSEANIGDSYEEGLFIKPIPVVDPLAYQQLRASEYPPMSDYLDGIVKSDAAQIKTYIDACLAVKAKYPKPV